MITRKQFVKAYNKYPPNKLSAWYFMYFSKRTKQEDLNVKYNFIWFWVFLFVIGFISTTLKLKLLIGISTGIFVGTLIPFVLIAFIAIILNNLRIKKIRKELDGISKAKYNELIDKYY